MAKRRGDVYPRLGLTLIKYFLIALLGAAAVTAFLAGMAFVTMNEVSKEESQQGALAQYVAEFQTYVTQQKVYSTDEGSIRAWNKKHIKLNFILHDDTVLYVSGDQGRKQRGKPYDTKANPHSFPDFTIQFEDKACTLSVVKYYHLPFQAVWLLLLYVVPFISFVAIYGLLLKNKIRYIRLLEEGIHIIEGGGLKFRIPIKGRDELTSLAQSINAMSEAMEERVEAEDQEKKRELNLIASASHDFRTPLTTAICYLDFIHDGKYSSEEERNQYLDKAREKVYYLKCLSENLFRHSVSESEALTLHLEPLDGRLLMGQLLSDFWFLLEDKGFTLNAQADFVEPFWMNTDANQLRRVFDNIATNIIKYADKAYQVKITVAIEDGWFWFRQSNRIRANVNSMDSFGIGMKNSAYIIRAHQGSLEAKNANGEYHLTFRLPLYTTVQ